MKVKLFWCMKLFELVMICMFLECFSSRYFVTAFKNLAFGERKWLTFSSTRRLVTIHSTDSTVAIATSTASKRAATFNMYGDDDTSRIILDPLVVCGPSGVGKGTIISRYMEEYNGKDYFGFTTSHTTRSPRVGEIHSVHYYFTNKEDMTERIRNGEFLEYAEVHGNYYGTSWLSLKDVYEKSNKKCLLDIDVQGVQKVRSMVVAMEEHAPSYNLFSTSSIRLKPKYLFIAPPDLATLEKRLIGRGTESEESLRRRTANAKAELEYGLQDGNFDVVLINDTLDKACQEFDQAIRKIYNF